MLVCAKITDYTKSITDDEDVLWGKKLILGVGFWRGPNFHSILFLFLFYLVLPYVCFALIYIYTYIYIVILFYLVLNNPVCTCTWLYIHP